MSASYDFFGTGSDGNGQGASGIGNGSYGALFGGDPGSSSAAGGGVATPPVSVTGMSSGQGIPGLRRPMGRATSTANSKPSASSMMSSKPSASAMQGQRRPMPRRAIPPVRGPINGFGPRPMPRPPGGGTLRGPGAPGGPGGARPPVTVQPQPRRALPQPIQARRPGML